MRVAVIGGTGFVGVQVVLALRRAGHEPLALARHEASAAGAPFRAADLVDPRRLEGALAGCDAVVSAAGSLHQSLSQTFHDVHFRGMRNLVEACRAQRVRRLVHLSSLGARPSSRSAFHRSKFLGEDRLRRSLLDVTVLRPSAIFGAGDDFVRPLARLLRRFPVAPLPGRGAARIQPIAVGDVAAAVVAALDRPATVGEAYDLPGPELLTISEIYDRVMATLGVRRPKVSIPYLLLEPMALVFARTPIGRFSFDQLAFVEEERPGDPAPAATALGLALTRFDAASLRPLVDAA